MHITNIDLLSKALRTMVFTLAVRKAGYYYWDIANSLSKYRVSRSFYVMLYGNTF